MGPERSLSPCSECLGALGCLQHWGPWLGKGDRKGVVLGSPPIPSVAGWRNAFEVHQWLALEAWVLGISLVTQWLRICLAMQGTWVQSLVRELRSHMLRSN